MRHGLIRIDKCFLKYYLTNLSEPARRNATSPALLGEEREDMSVLPNFAAGAGAEQATTLSPEGQHLGGAPRLTGWATVLKDGDDVGNQGHGHGREPIPPEALAKFKSAHSGR
jgi:hypothetical protein